MRVNMRLDDSDLRRGIDGLKRRFPMAIKRSLNRTATTTKAAMAKAMNEDTKLGSTWIKEQLKVVINPPAASISVQGTRIPLIRFGARGPEPSRGRGGGVSYRNPGGGRGRAPHAFIATMASGHRGVFHRSRFGRGLRYSTRDGKKRETIEQLHGPSLVRVFQKFMDLGATTAEEALRRNLTHEISYALSKE